MEELQDCSGLEGNLKASLLGQVWIITDIRKDKSIVKGQHDNVGDAILLYLVITYTMRLS